MDPVVILYCTGILSNLLANNQMNKEFLFSRGTIATLYRVLISSYSIPASTPNQQQRVEDIQVILKIFGIYEFFSVSVAYYWYYDIFQKVELNIEMKTKF